MKKITRNKILTLIAAALAVCMLAACGGGSSSGGGASSGGGNAAPARTAEDYANIIVNSRNDEMNEAFMVLTPNGEGGYNGTAGFSAEYSAEQLDSFAGDMVMPMLGLTEEMSDCYAVSASVMMTQSYGVAIVRPADGQTDAVKAALEQFIESQINACSQYLPDQYEIAQAATVTVAPSGEVVLVCCEDSASVQAAILEALAS